MKSLVSVHLINASFLRILEIKIIIQDEKHFGINFFFIIICFGSRVRYILQSSNPTSYTLLLSGGLLWTVNTMSDFFKRLEGMRPFILLALCAPPLQKASLHTSTGFQLCFSQTRRLNLLRLDLIPCLVGTL